ncbi:MAG TPA: YihY/virulence factor BrkB family protein [Clostridia bacterium]|nr:YihY/virulence factor BrkB family protein [Clostridia bacterium]
MSKKSVWSIVKNTANEFVLDRTTTLGAALAYYAIFSIGPLLVIAIGVAGLLFSDAAAQQQVRQQLQSVLGPKTADIVQSMMASQQRGGSLIAIILGSIVLLLGASGVFSQLKTSLNLIWQVKPKPGRGVWGLILDRLVSLVVVLGIGILLLASMLLTTFLSAFYDTISQYVPLPSFVLQLLNVVASLLIMTLLFAIIFKILPDVKLRWRDVWVGAFWTALFFIAGEYLLSLYLSRQGTASAYGAAGSVVVLLLWIYYSSLILLAGAEFTRVYASRKGTRIEPAKYAMPMNETAPGEDNRAWQS